VEGVTIKADGQGRLLVTFPYSEARVEQMRRIPGRRWLSEQKMWSVPDSPEARAALTEIFAAPPPKPAGEWIGVAPPKPEKDGARKPRAAHVPGKPLTTNPPHPLIKAVDDELVLRGMAYPQGAFGSGTRKSYGQHLRNYFDWLDAKDRYTLLSETALAVLREYFQAYKPKDWLFAGDDAGDHLSERSAQQVFQDARKKAGIIKPATFHTLRHSFATHLLEDGVDIRYIQELLGHGTVETTQRYTHVTQKGMERIKSPLDNLKL
jgi:hypothetical protein